MTLLVTVETGGMTQAQASRAGNIGGIVIGGWEGIRVVSSLLVFQAMLSLFFLLIFLVGGLAILGMREMWGREVWELILSFFGGGRSFVLRILSRWSLKLGHNSGSESVTSGKRWSIFLKKEKSWKLSSISLTNASQLSSSLSRCSIWALSKGLNSSHKSQKKSDFSRTPSVSNLIRMDWRGDKMPNCEFPPSASTGSFA